LILARGEDKVVNFVDTPSTASPTKSPTASPVDLRKASISGIVTDTLNNPLRRAIITLTNSDGDLIATSVTGTDGIYKFIALPPGEYTVEEENPPEYIDVSPSIVDLNLAPGEEKVENFVDAPSTASPTKSPTASPVELREASISGIVTDTLNNPLRRAIITLENSDGDVIATALTGTNGKYKFIGLPPGEYTVEEENPPGYIDVSPSVVVLDLAQGEEKVVNFVDTTVNWVSYEVAHGFTC
jgi:protocatechuate 3,4-dioxygenase beta subunit